MRKRTSRDLDRLLTDFGTTMPRVPPPAPEPRQPRLFTQVPTPRGIRGPGNGWSPTLPPLAGYEMTSEQTPVMWPLIAGNGLPPTGAQMGVDVLTGGCFYADPHGWVTDDDIPVTNPNIFIFGKPGRGKSGTTKIFLLRMMQFGYRALILGDLKDEYERLCRALGVEPFRIGHGLGGRINPFDIGPLGEGWEDLDPAQAKARTDIIFARWLSLVRGLVASQKIGERPVPFGPSDETAITEAIRNLTGVADGNTHLREITIPELWAALDEPTPDMLTACRYPTQDAFYSGTRNLRDSLGALCKGSLRGLFDGPTTFDPDWRSPIQSLSLNSLSKSGDEAVGLALMCLNSWGQGMREVADPGDRRIVLRDEAWRQTRLGVEAVKTLDSNLRLSRKEGDVQVVTYHKPSDPLSAGDAGSQAMEIAKDLLHLADIRVLLGQDQAVADELGHLLGISETGQRVVTGWAMQAKGRALWMVGERMFKVQTRMTEIEKDLTYTNEAIA